MPRFTIGIPTYNRASFLPRAIECALSQTYPDVEVLVSDNASTDETPEIVRSYGDRVRYHRNATNLGSWPNIAQLPSLAAGEYFSWLQDDDLIHRDFARRAIEGLTASPDVRAYTCFSMRTPSPTTVFFPSLVGPAVPLEWMKGGIRLLDGDLVVPLSVFYSVSNPPSLAFRTSVVRDAVRVFDPKCELYNERLVLVEACRDGKFAIDPWPGAVFSYHPEQEHLKIFRDDPEAQWRQWVILTNALCRILEGIPEEKWLGPFLENLAEVDPVHRISWLNGGCPLPRVWKTADPLADRLRRMVHDSLPEDMRIHVLKDPEEPVEPLRIDRYKSVVKDLLPPVLTRAISAARDQRR